MARRNALGYATSFVGIALMTVLIGLILSLSAIPNISMLYLVVVLAISVAFGRGPAVFASILAFLAIDWFRTEPLHTFTVGNPAEWIALGLFLLTAIVTGQLAAGQRRRAQEAEQRKREAVVLYDLVRLMNGPDLEQALNAAAARLRDELQLSAVAIEIAAGATGIARAAVGEGGALELVRRRTAVDSQVLGQGPLPTGELRGAPGRWIRIVPPRAKGTGGTVDARRMQVVPVTVKGRRVGELLIMRREREAKSTLANDRLLSAAANQLGAAADRVRLQREVTETEILRRTDELKTALLNAVSHDLRTPLASIIASAGSLRQRDVAWTEEERREFAETIEEEALRLNQIVGNLLDLSRIEGGNLRPEKGWYDLGALVDDVLGRLRPLVAGRQTVVDIPDDLPPVFFDYVEIDQVLSNLIENATKYTKAGTETRISARTNNTEVQVEVADRGPGIPSSALLHLFEPFYRVAREGSRSKGTGLGLAVAKGLVEAHGGRMWAENRTGGGARFVFTLPLTAEPDTSGETKERAV
ncbi:MAG: DUF4118 domain-containing protein [Chloroflexi bacterium]|nr:DUF4118 domain-containing protein [Chloroflexota bacterium]